QGVIRIAALCVLAFILTSCTTRQLSYDDEIAAWHAEKDEFMRESSQSPVPKEERGSFQPLPYFPTNQEDRVPAALNRAPADDILEMATSTGQLRKMQRIGSLDFTLKNERMKLTAFVEAGEKDLRRLFVPFGDRTNGTETYPGGRYLDLDRTATGVYD